MVNILSDLSIRIASRNLVPLMATHEANVCLSLILVADEEQLALDTDRVSVQR